MAALWQVGDKNIFFPLTVQEGMHMSGLREKQTNRIYKVIIICVIIPHRCVFFKQNLKGLHCGIRQREQVWRDNILFGPAKNVIILLRLSTLLLVVNRFPQRSIYLSKPLPL